MPDKSAKLRIFIILGILLSTTSAARAFQDWEGALKPENFNEARLNKLQPPDKVMDAIGLQSGMTAAEIGAGRGRYVMHLAHRVGKSGKVYAEDIDAGGAPPPGAALRTLGGSRMSIPSSARSSTPSCRRVVWTSSSSSPPTIISTIPWSCCARPGPLSRRQESWRSVSGCPGIRTARKPQRPRRWRLK